MLLNKKGQLGPQELEDIPAALIAFMAMIGALMIIFNIYAGHISESGLGDLHEVGKRLADTLAGDIFKSEYSKSFGDLVLDKELLDDFSSDIPSLEDLVGSVEYGFNGVVRAGSTVWDFGEPAPSDETVLSYYRPFTILSGGSLYNGGVEVKVWRK